VENEEKYKSIKAEILGDDEDEDEDWIRRRTQKTKTRKVREDILSSYSY
jgi:hypothetical protein